jgi:hypothetical protein
VSLLQLFTLLLLTLYELFDCFHREHVLSPLIGKLSRQMVGLGAVKVACGGRVLLCDLTVLCC